MADWKTLVDPKLKKEFEKAGPDPRAAERLRDRFSKSLITAKQQFASETPTKGRKMWKLNNGVVEFSPTLGGNAVTLDGDATLYIPSERFPSFIDALSAALAAGELDVSLEAALGGGGYVSGGKATGGGQRTFSEESKLNIRVGGFRRGGKADDEIRALLLAEGKDKAAIDKAIARKPAKK